MTDPTLTLTCPACGAKTRLDPGQQMIQCEYCGTEQVVRAGVLAPTTPVMVERPPVPLPQRVQIEKRGQSINMHWRWFSFKYIPLALFCVIWDAFIFFWYGMVFSLDAPAIAAIFPLLHVAVGVFLTYTVLAGFLNTTYVRLNKKEFSVQHTPLPWPGAVQMPVEELAQLYCKRNVSQGRRSTTVTYELWAETRDGRSRKLLTGLDEPDVAQYLEQQVESFLDIPDRRMRGELGRGFDE